MEGAIISYVRISDDALAQPHGGNLNLGYTFGFPTVNCAPKWTKTMKFQCVPFEPNFKILKDF